MRVAILMGGPSGEHEVSLRSGQGVSAALARRGMTVTPLVVPRGISVPQACGFVRAALLQAAADVVFIALHGPFGEDGTVQHVCEELRLAYTGSGPQASRIGMDKIASRQRFEAAGLSVPRGWTIDARSWSPGALAGLSYPVVVKPATQGSSLGISVVNTAEQLSVAVAEAGQYGPDILMEEYVAGRELTVGVLGEEALPVVEIRPRQGFFDYTAKYTSGLTDYLVPAPLPPHVAQATQAVGLAAHRALGCRHLSRADLILSHEGLPVLLEVNTVPGFTPTSLLPKAAACVGISYDALCEQLVVMAAHDSRPLEKAAAAHG